jgi:hypothetical protein
MRVPWPQVYRDDQSFYGRARDVSGPRPQIEVSALLEWNAAARTVGELAAEALPRTLVLTHLLPAPTSPADEDAYADEVRTGGFEGPTIVARDLLRIPIDDPARRTHSRAGG